MGLTMSLVAPTLESKFGESIDSRPKSVLDPTDPTDPTEKTEETKIKYLKKNGPPTILGPSPGNVPSPNPIAGAPTIRPPDDTTSKVPDNSTYDTLQMTPDVDWAKKTILPAKSNG